MWPARTSVMPTVANNGLRSTAPQTASTTRPPGRSTRRVSANAAAGSAAIMYA